MPRARATSFWIICESGRGRRCGREVSFGSGKTAHSVARSCVAGAISNPRAGAVVVVRKVGPMLARLTRGEMTRGSRRVGHSRYRPLQPHMGRRVARFAVARRSGSRLVHPRPARYPSLYVANAVPDRRAPRRGCSRDYRRGAPDHTAARRHCDAIHRFRSETRTRRRCRPRRCSRWRACSLSRLVAWALIASPRAVDERYSKR